MTKLKGYIAIKTCSEDTLTTVFKLIFNNDLYVAAVDDDVEGPLLYFSNKLYDFDNLDCIEIGKVKYPDLIISRGTGEIFGNLFSTLIIVA
jgi:hypothetical protein